VDLVKLITLLVEVIFTRKDIKCNYIIGEVMIIKSYLFILLALFVFSCATNQKEEESHGSLNESCYANLTCNDGLICIDRKCIKEVFTPECVTDNDCDNNQACNNEVCIENTNTCNPICENWEKCNENTLVCE